MRHIKVDAIILKRKNIAESDRILTILTREFGKMQIKAVGVRKITSRRASHIEPLNKVKMSLYKGNGMPILTEIASEENFLDIKSNLSKVGLAYHLCELVDGLCPENLENAHVFDLLHQTLSRLGQEGNFVPLIHSFEVELLSLLGYYSSGSHDLRGAKASYFIESILERRLKSRQLLPHFIE